MKIFLLKKRISVIAVVSNVRCDVANDLLYWPRTNDIVLKQKLLLPIQVMFSWPSRAKAAPSLVHLKISSLFRDFS